MKIAYFDCIAGASGDMILAALLDAGVPLEVLRSAVEMLGLPGELLQVRRVQKNGLGALKVDVHQPEASPERDIGEILSLVEKSRLPDPVKAQAMAILLRLGCVESRIHGKPLTETHLHELSGVDTLVDVCGALLGLAWLAIDCVIASPLPVGRGMVKSAHGLLPLPAPATLALLAGVPLRSSELENELVTPTGAAILTSLAAEYGSIPSMRLSSVGYGAGGRDLPIPNLLRVLVGETEISANGQLLEVLEQLETNLDDLNPQIYPYVIDLLFQAGALDVFLTPIQMKKNRPGTLISVLCQPQAADRLAEILFRETSTLGIRRKLVERLSLARTIATVETVYGFVRIKIAHLGENKVKYAPEFEDCRRLAEEQHVPLIDVYRSALQAVAE